MRVIELIKLWEEVYGSQSDPGATLNPNHVTSDENVINPNNSTSDRNIIDPQHPLVKPIEEPTFPYHDPGTEV